MLCHCSTNTLRHFIRIVAHVDVPVRPRYITSRTLQTKTAAHASSRFRPQIPCKQRAFSSQPCLRDSVASAVKQNVPETRHDEVETLNKDDQTPKEASSTQGAFVDFSLEALDDILAEYQSDLPGIENQDRPTIAGEESPAGFVTTTLARQRERRDRKVRDIQRDLPRDTNIKFANTTSPRSLKSSDDDLSQYSTFPRLPRINQDTSVIPTLKSRLVDPLKIQNPPRNPSDLKRKPREHWQIDKDAIKAKYPSGYMPQKRLSPDAIAGIRALHAQMPEEYHTRKLAETFQVSPEAISRILRSKWTPNAEEEADRARRWQKRGETVWTRYAEMGVKPPKKWRELGVGKDLPEDSLIAVRREKRLKKGAVPALVTQARRTGGVFQVGGKRRKASGDDGPGFI